MANLKSQGCGIRIYDTTVSPNAYNEIGQVMSISGPDGSVTEIDVTNLSSSAKEFIIGLPDEGSVSLEVSWDHASATAQHDTLWTARANATEENIQIFLTDSPNTTLTFQAFVTTYSISLGVDDKVAATIGLRITGAVTIA
jgi:hypothetical protein